MIKRRVVTSKCTKEGKWNHKRYAVHPKDGGGESDRNGNEEQIVKQKTSSRTIAPDSTTSLSVVETPQLKDRDCQMR